MKFRVFEMETHKDVTDEREWYINPDGDLVYMTGDIDYPLYAVDGGEFYYKLEVEVV